MGATFHLTCKLKRSQLTLRIVAALFETLLWMVFLACLLFDLFRCD